MNWTTNSVGRTVPTEHRDRLLEPFSGVDHERQLGKKSGPPIRTCREYPADGDKRVQSLAEALEKLGLRSGMTISTHHHFRNGDKIAHQVFEAAKSLGIKDLTWFPSAAFPCHESLVPFIECGVLRGIEGSLNGPLATYLSQGKMPELGVLRSHGGRYRALQDGEVHVDLAVIAAPSCDKFGNMTGAFGPSACGGLGFAVGDAHFADRVLAATDHLVEFPCVPWQIAGNDVDAVVCLSEIGDPSQIVSGTTRITNSPERLRIAELTADFVEAAGILREGWSFQAGAGGISLAFTQFVATKMRDLGVHAAFARGGSTSVLVKMLEDGLVGAILDGQTFDLEGVRSLRVNENHIMTSPATSYNFHTKGNFASILDCAVLGATEIDLEFNANVVTHSDGMLQHGIGGWQDALFSKCTILAVPSMRNRVPIVRERLTTITGPGSLIDAVVCESGIAINPKRTDLIEASRDASLPLISLEQIMHSAENRAGGKSEAPRLSDQPVSLVTWVDGTILDTIFAIED